MQYGTPWLRTNSVILKPNGSKGIPKAFHHGATLEQYALTKTNNKLHTKFDRVESLCLVNIEATMDLLLVSIEAANTIHQKILHMQHYAISHCYFDDMQNQAPSEIDFS